MSIGAVAVAAVVGIVASKHLHRPAAEPALPLTVTRPFERFPDATRLRLQQRIRLAYFAAAPLGTRLIIELDGNNPGQEHLAAELLQACLRASIMTRVYQRPPEPQFSEPQQHVRIICHPIAEPFSQALLRTLATFIDIGQTTVQLDPQLLPGVARIELRGRVELKDDGSVAVR